MPPLIASIIFAIGILGLFHLDKGQGSRMSKGLWIAAIWLFLVCSRPVSMWFGMTPNLNTVNATQAYVEGSPIDRAVYLALLVAALAILAARSDKVGPLLRKNAPILFYLSFCAVSIFWSSFPFVAFKRWTKSLGDVAMVLIILTEADPLGALKRLLTRLGFFLFPLSVLFAKYYPEIGRKLTESWTEETTGISTQKNELGLICMMYGVFFLWMILSVYRDRGAHNRQRRLLAYGTMVAMIVWLLIQCNSMTSIVGFVSAGGVVWLSSRPSRKPALVHWLVVAVLGLAVTALFFDPAGGLLKELGRNATLTGRTDIWKLVLGLHTNPWVGVGYESFWLGPRLDFMRTAMPNFPVNEAHDGYLEVYLNLGWAGICLISLLVITGYRRIISAIRQDPATGSLFLGFFLCTLFYSFTEAGFRLMTASWIFLLLVVMGASRVVSMANIRRVSQLKPAIVAANAKPAYAKQRANLAT